MNVKHSSRNDSWGTPQYIVGLVKEVLGTIDLDPASSMEANKVIGAGTYYTESDDGLYMAWGAPGSVYLNPPGGKIGNKSRCGLFWEKLMSEDFGHAIFMAFSIEALQYTQAAGKKSILHYPFCVPSKRIRFIDPTSDAETSDLRSKARVAPSHSNVIVYVPKWIDKTESFYTAFCKLGKVRL